MRRAYRSGAAAAAPTAPAAPSTGYPTEGDSATLVPATTPGAYWYHAVTEEIVGVIEAAGLTADDTVVQLLAAIRTLITATAATETARGTVELATSAEARTGTDRTRAVTPAALRSRHRHLGQVSVGTTADAVLTVADDVRESWMILALTDTRNTPGSVERAYGGGLIMTTELLTATTTVAPGATRGWRVSPDEVITGHLTLVRAVSQLRVRRHITAGAGPHPTEVVDFYAVW